VAAVWFGSSKDLKLGLFQTAVSWFFTFVKNLQFYEIITILALDLVLKENKIRFWFLFQFRKIRANPRGDSLVVEPCLGPLDLKKGSKFKPMLGGSHFFFYENHPFWFSQPILKNL
jgi:hypothetical protein